MRQLHALNRTLGIIKVEPESSALYEFFFTIGKNTNPQFRALKICQYPDRAAQILFYLTDCTVPFGNFIMCSMAHIKPEPICTRFGQGSDLVITVGCVAKRFNNFHIAVASHLLFLFNF